jgi:diadenosine tetraphosphate (Ap4A) HIT family hydrolase
LAWPTRGAAWIDPAILILQLLEAGHTLTDADVFGRRFPSWRTAPAEAKEAFAAANAAARKEIARADTAPWKAAMAGHAVAFHCHLHTLPGNR